MSQPSEIFDAELSKEMCRRTDSLKDSSIDLAVRVKQAREFIAWSANHMRGSWLDWMESANTASRDVNILRMAFDRETKVIIGSGKDIRDFFNSPDYEKAHVRMKEMLDMLDRFSQLKKEGTMDAFAEFILKVSCK